MAGQSNKERIFELMLTGFGLVALVAVFFVAAADLDPLIFWAVS
jgi:hypothetical protein